MLRFCDIDTLCLVNFFFIAEAQKQLAIVFAPWQVFLNMWVSLAYINNLLALLKNITIA
jgi:hypothetical protein